MFDDLTGAILGISKACFLNFGIPNIIKQNSYDESTLNLS